MPAGLLLLAHGTPERVEDIESYLNCVRGGKPGRAHVVENVRHQDKELGGASPLLTWTRKRTEGLATRLGIPVFFGMRNWHPFIAEVMPQIRGAGIERLAAVCQAPQHSKLSVALYIKRTEEAKAEAGLGSSDHVGAFCDELLLIEAFAEPAPVADNRRVLFTPHSLPEKPLTGGNPYDREVRETAALAARSGCLGLRIPEPSYDGTNGSTLESMLDRYAADGVVTLWWTRSASSVITLKRFTILISSFVSMPPGGISLSPPKMPNDSSTFTAALTDVAWHCATSTPRSPGSRSVPSASLEMMLTSESLQLSLDLGCRSSKTPEYEY